MIINVTYIGKVLNNTFYYTYICNYAYSISVVLYLPKLYLSLTNNVNIVRNYTRTWSYQYD